MSRYDDGYLQWATPKQHGNSWKFWTHGKVKQHWHWFKKVLPIKKCVLKLLSHGSKRDT